MTDPSSKCTFLERILKLWSAFFWPPSALLHVRGVVHADVAQGLEAVVLLLRQAKHLRLHAIHCHVSRYICRSSDVAVLHRLISVDCARAAGPAPLLSSAKAELRSGVIRHSPELLLSGRQGSGLAAGAAGALANVLGRHLVDALGPTALERVANREG